MSLKTFGAICLKIIEDDKHSLIVFENIRNDLFKNREDDKNYLKFLENYFFETSFRRHFFSAIELFGGR